MHQTKRKILRGNYKPHVNKTLRSGIMKCTQLKIKAMKPKSKNDVIEYKKQHNLVVKLKKRCKKGFFDNLETKNKSKPFWSTSKPYFSNEHAKGYADILLIENNKILLDNRKVANVFNQSLKPLTYLNGQMNRNLKVQSCKLYGNKNMIASTQITNTEIFAFITVLVFKLLGRKVLFIIIKDNRNC